MFVANEYVAGCYNITCDDPSHNIYSGVVKNVNSPSQALAKIATTHTNLSTTDIHQGTRYDIGGHWASGENSNRYYHHYDYGLFSAKACRVSASEVAKSSEHPNASN